LMEPLKLESVRFSIITGKATINGCLIKVVRFWCKIHEKVANF
jgi:hypothetical protein